jgi:intraflagellar transport protein 172
MYRDAGMWTEALALAQRHLPHQLAEVSLAYSQAEAQRGTGGTKVDFLSAGQQWEQQKQWDRAVEAYLNARPGLLEDPKELEEIWECAIDVARRHMPPEKFRDIAIKVTHKLKAIGRHGAAAEFLRELNDIDGAVRCAMDGRCWAKARELAIGSSTLEAEVDAAYQSALRSAEDTDGLLELGHRTAALDVLVERKEWDRLWQMADREQIHLSVRARYAGLQAAQILAAKGDLTQAVRTLKQHGAPPPGPNVQMYHDLVLAVLGQSYAQANLDHEHSVSDLRDVLFHLASSHDGAREDALGTQGAGGFEQLLMATHYYRLYLTCVSQGLKDIALKIAITLMRYSGIIPIDKAFYQAGTMARDQGHDNLAFVLLNRYIDLTEAIEEGNIDSIDNADFVDATNVPFPFDLPTQQYLPREDDREEIRDWVLTICMDKSVDQQLPAKQQALGTVYSGLYASDLPTCIVTGYPVQKWELLNVNKSVANKVRNRLPALEI